MLGFECLDFVRMLQRQANIVQTIEHAVLAVVSDIKFEAETGRGGHCLLSQVYIELVTLGGLLFGPV